MKHPTKQKRVGIYFTINDQDKPEIINIVKKFADLGLDLYATKGTANVIRSLGLECTDVARLSSNEEIFRLMDEGKIDYIVYTGKTDVESISNYIGLHHHAILKGITVLTSLDTTNALADVIAGRYNEFNTELVDINSLRKHKLKLQFSKIHSGGNDYIIFNNFSGDITCPESLAISFCDRHYAIGADGVVLIEKSEIADAKVRIFNRDGSDGGLSANPLRCVAKYLFDNKLVGENLVLETCCGVKNLVVNSFNEKASSVSIDLGKPVVENNKKVNFNGVTYNATYVNVGNPHLVVFSDDIKDIDIEAFGQYINEKGNYPADIYIDLVRIVNKVTLRLRAYEKILGETLACGTAAAAAAIAATEYGNCVYGEIITVKQLGGDLFVKYENGGSVEVDGPVKQSFEGMIEI